MNLKDEKALDLEWVMLIMEAKETGISIEEVRQFLQSISSNS
ncbi:MULTISPECIES: anti-repressor SinI family protein [Priestia]|nr:MULTISPECIES: anti-repressor SinI family protein [Priestia]MBU3569575.1 anti-repressor SinI family protein [Priestia aryabhattai]MCQ9283779.1 anti-repressor SinI family protein [Priestia aryabhattai]MDE8674188.1 anti-repressor SinI family protein [Priestia aryabhattai]WDC90531.1 anti-repressor SinI family protein [Priestia megaterium]WDL87386.1 anti-repressor SinI family protein [Priestia aryabhattai]